ncbi:integrase, catalytic domain protein [Burkholderia pseudomallei MSHR983]|nr:hypothetical protein BDL_5133 [Burkholderia pseudomallei MSHR305]AHK69461.1 hypothetical protein BBX_4299 [Burkholderia pseudomallei MSHR520]AIP17959.1 integrase core domain protein [Burkholderia pseudomallei MSHR5855]AIP42291.1 integrase core domain protein [Burkholderia pseudomallei MSHR5848]AIP83340.1 integrase, catalytic domain protein [Burkholderia pseudomallei]KGU58303.1 integrase, catalytic domain protein [Burkholderia pseudomallei MSHR983]
MDLWAYHHKVEIAFSRPGKPDLPPSVGPTGF